MPPTADDTGRPEQDHARTRSGDRSRPRTGPDRPDQQATTGSPSRTGRRRRPAGRTRHRRALRREAPTVIAMLLDEGDFTAMTRHPSFPFDDYGQYLHHLDGLLRSLHAQGTHVTVTHFDPDDYASYCRGTRRPPDTPTTRTHYVAEATTTGPGVHYARQPVAELRALLTREVDRRTVWERATDILMDSGPCPDCGQDLAHCAFDDASDTLLRLLEAVGPGAHHVVCSLPADDGPPLAAALHAHTSPDGDLHFSEADALVLGTVLAAAMVTDRTAGIVVRTLDPDGDTVRGWELHGGETHPLSEAAVFDAYCTDPITGTPIPPEPGVHYAPGIPLP
ncbi:hypothetical protein SAMN05216223_121149 [Actinacidiphila yanglinensis]|uniref:Uncharacterized protein n=1 Tax=Actinacidiphila yanglinensis TaxID=310779 RepID=A0A1H6DZN2_9ACTN|nr:hypothetical protein [Actinacidiphila yanglinensis]SEG90313.1 hypothetical protein SAMN05216223_121149 [Actinacidiphila yanglinensis]